MHIGDDVIISGKIEDIFLFDDGVACNITVKLPSGRRIFVHEPDIKAYHPFHPIPEKGERRGQ